MSTEKETSITEEYFRQRSQQLGWKFTNQRYSIYRCMVGNKNHPTADEVKKMLESEYPNISRDSVFRILNDFVSVGLIGKLEFSSPIRFDGNSSCHGHFQCRQCKSIIDFSTKVDEQQLSNFAIAQVDAIETVAHGLCKSCKEQ
jgi:Fe2+ or Zn2+ uptake regulation protein